MSQLVSKGDLATRANGEMKAIKGAVLNYLPTHMKARLQSMLQGLYDCVLANPDVLSQPAAFRSCAVACARTGLVPGTTMEADAHILPFKGKATLIINYKGHAELAYRSGKVAAITFGCVREGDELTYAEGSDGFIKHRKAQKRGERTGAWCNVKLTNGCNIPKVLTADEVLAVAAKSPSGTRGPWGDPQAADWMWAKTALKAALKTAPRSAEMALAEALDERDADAQAAIIRNLESGPQEGLQAEDVPVEGAEPPKAIERQTPRARPPAANSPVREEQAVLAGSEREPGQEPD